MSSNLVRLLTTPHATSSNEKGFLVRSSFTFLNYVFINIAG